jgi:hypothetical protein
VSKKDKNRVDKEKINEILQGITPYLKNKNIATGHSLKQVKPWEQ